MHYRLLGRTGAQVSEIGMGCNRLGEKAEPDSHWIDLVHKAVDLGITVFDTAEAYGWGRSEEILGQAIGNRDDVLIASKVSRVRESNVKEWSPARIIAHAEESLRRLRRETIDIYQLHSPSLDDMQRFDWPEAMQTLKAQGKIRFAGVSINDAASGRWLIENGLAEVLQVDYSMLTTEVGDAVFPLAEKHGVGILIRMPMARGVLTGKFMAKDDTQGHRASLLGDKLDPMIEHARTLSPLAEQHDGTFGQFALRYAISPGAVSAAIPGARTVEQLTQNVAASNGRGLDDDILTQIAAIQATW
ncbi:MAG: aldo/keto reductase [Caldilineaceae bacterium]|nr:aldo/keto reductase [Caldilineaceae bacterium]